MNDFYTLDYIKGYHIKPDRGDLPAQLRAAARLVTELTKAAGGLEPTVTLTIAYDDEGHPAIYLIVE